MTAPLIDLGYLVAASLFVLALKGLGHPRTAVRGNLLGAVGMLLAVVVTLLDRRVLELELILAGILVGGAIGALLAVKIEMTAMPQLVALFNGFGGGASVLVAGAALLEAGLAAEPPTARMTTATVASGLIGTVTFWGSLVAFGKLQGLLTDRPLRYPGQQIVHVVLLTAAIAFGVSLVRTPEETATYSLVVAVASVLGVLAVLPVGGADMPVVIALLNALSGIAAAATGFVLLNNILIIAGALVGASGLILTRIMCRAMNRSLSNVLLGLGAKAGAEGAEKEDIYTGRVKSTSAEEVALLLDGAHRIVIVPGYGMAVAQAQHAVAELVHLLEARGAEVEFAIHPVAGRMPGHMNVLLAEANIPYEKLKDLDEINDTFDETDVVLVIGANDIVNPTARTKTDSPIAGMPILDVDKAHTVVVIKRSLGPGFAGIPNPLFAAPNALMLFGDGKDMVVELADAVKEL